MHADQSEASILHADQSEANIMRREGMTDTSPHYADRFIRVENFLLINHIMSLMN